MTFGSFAMMPTERPAQRGKEAFIKYEEFHDEMVKSMLENLDDIESDTLMSALQKINTWIRLEKTNNK